MGCGAVQFYEFGMHYIRTDKIIAIRLGKPGEFSKMKNPDAWNVAILYDGSPNLKSISHAFDTREEADNVIKILTNYKTLIPQDEGQSPPEII